MSSQTNDKQEFTRPARLSFALGVLYGVLLLCLGGVGSVGWLFFQTEIGNQLMADLGLTGAGLDQDHLQVTEGTSISSQDRLGEIDVEYPTKMSPGSSDSVIVSIYIPERLVSLQPVSIDRVTFSPENPPIMLNRFQATILISETVRIELSSPIFEIESQYPLTQQVDIDDVAEPTRWAWTVVAPDKVGKHVLTIRVYLGNDDTPTWVRSLQVEVVELTSSTTPSSISTPAPFSNRISGIILTAVIVGVINVFFVTIVLIVTNRLPVNRVPLQNRFSPVDQIKIQIESKQRRLQILKHQAAVRGQSAEPSILIEIEDIETEIEALQVKLKEIQNIYEQ